MKQFLGQTITSFSNSPIVPIEEWVINEDKTLSIKDRNIINNLKINESHTFNLGGNLTRMYTLKRVN